MLHTCFKLRISLTSKTCISRYEIIELLQVRHVKAYSTGVQPLPKQRGMMIRIASPQQEGRPVYDKERKNTFTQFLILPVIQKSSITFLFNCTTHRGHILAPLLCELDCCWKVPKLSAHQNRFPPLFCGLRKLNRNVLNINQ